MWRRARLGFVPLTCSGDLGLVWTSKGVAWAVNQHASRPGPECNRISLDWNYNHVEQSRDLAFLVLLEKLLSELRAA
jgi:hypothetical protein